MKKIIFSLLLLVTLACNKENSNNTIETQEIELSKISSEGDAQSEQSYSEIFDDVMGTSDEVGVFGSGIFGKEYGLDTVPRCFTVRIERPNAPQPFPVIVTINFPQSGCMGPDGRVRRGQIKTTYTNRLLVPGAESITTFLNFSIDSVTVGGTYKVKNMVEPIQITIFPPQYNHKWLATVVGGRLGFPNGNVVEWNSSKTIEQVEGSHTPPLTDNVFKIIGNSNGASIRNSVTTSWNSETTEPLFKRTTCRWIVKGKIRTIRRNLSNTSPWVGILDFGNGNCDNIATLNVNGNIRTITLP